MKFVKPMKKIFFLHSGAVLLLLGLAGCTQTLTNLTPESAQRNPSNMYRFSVQCNVDERKVVPGSFDLNLVIDGEKHPMQKDNLAANIYYQDHRLGIDRFSAKYYFDLTYKQNNRGKLHTYTRKTNLAEFNIQERGGFCLENERGPVGADIKVLGRGFTEGDRVVLGEYSAATTYLSDNVLVFRLPPVEAGKSYPVYVLGGGEKIFVGNILVDNSFFSLEPNELALKSGEKASLLIKTSSDLDSELYVNVTTNVPNSVIMPEVKIPAGERSVSVEIEGGEIGEGHLFISAQGFAETKLPIKVTDNGDDVVDDAEEKVEQK